MSIFDLYADSPTRRALRLDATFPRIVVLCGSTRFVDTFNSERARLTLAGEIVLSIEIVTTQSREVDPQHSDPQAKERLDELHFRKIELADYVRVLDVDCYIGESTRNEIGYAIAIGKPLEFLSGRDAVTALGLHSISP